MSSRRLSSEADRHLARALELAARGRATAAPNPRVGAVVTDAAGAVVGEGYHERPGSEHAEVVALRSAGERARGGTLFVSLEPCSHQGRTPPCVDAVVDAGIARVVACHRDPDPRVAGSGFEALRRAGVDVRTGHRLEEAVRLNLAFLVHRALARPAVSAKWAMTLDGRIATRGGESQWISSPEARHRSLELREEHDAILVGSGTVLADDPRLSRRLGAAPGPILRVVMDRRLRCAPAARLFAEAGPVLLYTAADAPDGRRRALAERGVEILALASVEPATVVADLYARGVQSVLVEGGGGILGAFFDGGLIDRVYAFVAPRLVGGNTAPGPIGGRGRARLVEALELAATTAERVGADLTVEGISSGCLRDLYASVGG